MAVRYTMPYTQWVDGNSAVVAGGKLEFYESGTSTPKNTYSDQNLTTPNANPVVADSDGRFGSIFLEAGLYKVILKDSAGSQIWSADPIGSAFESVDVTGTFSLSGVITPSQITADQNNYNPTGLSSATVVRLNSDASRNITGLVGGASGRLLILHNVGSFNIVLKDESASSTAANRFALASDITIAADQAALIQYDATLARWYAVAAPAVDPLTGAISFSGDISPSQITANQNDYNPTGLSAASTLRINSDALRTITGLAGGSDGRILLVHNVGSFAIILANESASSSAANRFSAFADIVLNAGQSVFLQYDATSSRWRFPGYPNQNVTAKLSHQQTSGTAGGGTTATTWTVCPLNTEDYDPYGIVSVSSNQFTLQAGTYEVSAWQSLVYATNAWAGRIRLRNTSDSTTLGAGPSDGGSDNGADKAVMILPPTTFTITAAKVFELQYYVSAAQATNGLGAPVSTGEAEVYAAVTIKRIA